MNKTQLIFGLVTLVIIVGIAYYLTQTAKAPEPGQLDLAPTTNPVVTTPTDNPSTATTTPDSESLPTETIIGQSTNGADLVARHFGTGAKEVLLVSGVHGSDAPNAVALGNELVDYFSADPTVIPDTLRVTVIPNFNPDGVANGSRFNANNVDLNRNFDCDWSAESQWRDQTVSGGRAPFSEPEAAALRDYVSDKNLVGTIVWFAAEGVVYPAACTGGPTVKATLLAETFATASGYETAAEFDAYQINGDMTNWLADRGVPAISVLLGNRTDTEWEKNRAGIQAVLAKLAE